MTRNFSVTGTYKLQIPGGVLAVAAVAATGTTPAGEGSFTIRTIRCNNPGAADRWLMVFASSTLPANGTAPLFAALNIPLNYFSEDTFPDGRTVDGPAIFFAISSTRDTLTVDVAATVDISVDIDEYELQPVGK